MTLLYSTISKLLYRLEDYLANRASPPILTLCDAISELLYGLIIPLYNAISKSLYRLLNKLYNATG